MRRLRWLAIAAAVIFVPAIGAGVFVATLDLNRYKSTIRAALQDAIGRQVDWAGPLQFSWLPWPSLTASGVRVANAEWGSEPSMATVGTFTVDVAVAPLLSGDLVVRGLKLSKVRLLLERGADGLANWQAGAAAADPSPGRGGTLPVVRQLDLTDVTVAWKTDPKAPERLYRVDRLTLDGSGPGAPLTMTLLAKLDGDALELTGALPSLADVMAPDAILPVDVEGSYGGSPLAMAATLRLIRGADGALSGVQADGLSGSLGALAAVGSASLDLAGARPRIEARLEAETLDLTGFGAAAAGPRTDPLDRPVPIGWLPALDGRLAVTIGRLVADRWTIDSLAATATLDNGLLTVDPLGATVAGGALHGRAMLDTRKRPARVALAGTAARIDMGAVYLALDNEALIEGIGDAAVDLHGQGETVRAWLGSAGGVARLVVRDGTVMNRYWELIAEDLVTRFIPLGGASSGDRGRLNCLVGRFDVTKGIADATVLMIDSDRVTVAGAGTVDLARQTLDLRLVPRPKDPSLISLATPILLKGPIADPRPSPDPIGVARSLGGIAAGAIVGPLGLLLPFISSGTLDEPCPEAIAAAEGIRPVAKSKASTEPDKPGGIKGFFDSIRKNLK